MTTIQVLCRQLWQGVEVANVLCFDQANVTEGGIQNTLDQLAELWLETMATKQSLNWSLVNFLVRVFDGGDPFTVSFDTPDTPLTGTADSPDLPRNVSLLISTSHVGPRPNRGKIHVAGMTESSWDGDSFDAPTTAVADGFAEGLTMLADTTFVVSRRNSLANTAISHGIDSWLVRGGPGSQRGRRT